MPCSAPEAAVFRAYHRYSAEHLSQRLPPKTIECGDVGEVEGAEHKHDQEQHYQDHNKPRTYEQERCERH